MWCRFTGSLWSVLAFAILAAWASPATAAFGDVQHSIPCAGANTSDIAWVEGTLYQVIFSPTEERNIYQLDPASGQILAVIPYAGSSPQGLAYDGHNLWQGDLSGDTIYKLDPVTGEIRGSFLAPGGTDGQPLGMGWDGEFLWIADSRAPEKIWQVDSTGVVISQIPAPGASPYGLTWALGYIWVSDNSVGGTGMLYRLDPETGEVLDSCPCPDNGGSPNGMAHDGEYLWVAVNSTDLIYQVDDGLESGNAPPATRLAPAAVVLDRVWEVPSGDAVGVRFTLPAPSSVGLSLFDVSGRRAGLSLRRTWPAGTHETRLGATGLAAGVYLVRLQALGQSRSGKVVLLP